MLKFPSLQRHADWSSFWKWESIFGRFTLSDWNPIKKDNIVSVEDGVLC